jgi:hypothetical protein
MRDILRGYETAIRVISQANNPGKNGMKKVAFFIACLFSTVTQIYGQHKVNDIKDYNGWYKITIEIGSHDNAQYTVMQCYPNGDEYTLNDDERRQAPLYVKVFCIGMFEQLLKGQAEIFDRGGIQMKLNGVTLIVNFIRSDEEILSELGEDVVDKYRYEEW